MYYVGLCLAAVGAYFDDHVIPVSTVLFGVQFLFAAMALGAWAILRSGCRLSLANPGTFVRFVAWAVVLVPIATEAPQVLVRLASGGTDVWAVALRNVLGIALGVLCGTPALTLTLINGHTWIRGLSWKRLLELGALAGCLVAVGYFCFGRSIVGSTPLAMLYAPLPLLLWAGTRFGHGGVSWALLYIAFQATCGALHGRGPFTTANPADNILQLQLFLLSVSLPLMSLAVATGEQHRALTALIHESAYHAKVVAERQRRVFRRE
jgi:integral membrane sensor domain MASE1